MGLRSQPQCHCAGVVLLDGSFLRSARAMWELGVMMDMAASPDGTQPLPDAPQTAPLTLVPVLLMDAAGVTAAYEQHWTAARTEAARLRGMPPATLADLQRLLTLPGLCQLQVPICVSHRDVLDVMWIASVRHPVSNLLPVSSHLNDYAGTNRPAWTRRMAARTIRSWQTA